MALSWNEIKDRALAFSKEWADESSEDAEAKSFWDGFFNVFGVTRRRLASFEEAVKKVGGSQGYIDLFWKGMLLVEHKSRGKNLDRAYTQAIDYFPGIKERDLPRYILVSDFARLRLYDLETDSQHEFALKDFHKHTKLFAFIAGYETRSFNKEDPVNIKAAEQLGNLHDQLNNVGFEGHPLEVFLVRLLFCLFADDTGIFEQRGQFGEWIEKKTAEDGSDLGPLLAQLFQVLNTPPSKRLKNLDEHLAGFPYVDGKLFEATLPIAAFTSKMRESLLDASALDWSRISPAIFGSLFQSIMDTKARRNLGAHYTRESNILKALGPLFLDDLRAEFEQCRRSEKRLIEFHQKLAKIQILDPACGCGNFLVIAYRELRAIELEVLSALRKAGQSQLLDVSHLILVDVDQFYGIELEDFPAQIAQVALWLTDHQMNTRVSEEFGQYFVRLPLSKAPHILHGNALTEKWDQLVDPKQLTFIVGNPPFIGKQFQSASQKAELAQIFHDVKGAGILDYVACWYRKAAEIMVVNPAVRTAFVSTNSVTQGEQVSVLWANLFHKGVKILFAHRTFQWTSEARGKAAVHCVIVGFGLLDKSPKTIFEYESVGSEPTALTVKNINPYLVEGSDLFLENRKQPLCQVPFISFGSMPNDGGNFLLSSDEKAAFLRSEPDAERLLRRFAGSEEFINGLERWCLWLKGVEPRELRQWPTIMSRVKAVQDVRRASTRETTQRLGDTPTLFGEDRQPTSAYIAVPKTSSERRKYIPIGFCEPSLVASTELFTIANAGLYEFGVLSSNMHMAWVRAVCGRLKSDYRYSAGIVYNNFPWPDQNKEARRNIEEAAKAVLDARSKHEGSTLADLYDPLLMPGDLVKSHQALDRAVDAAYGGPKFDKEAQRVAFLFQRYEALATPLSRANRSR